ISSTTPSAAANSTLSLHDALPISYGTEQADVGAGRADGGEERQALLELLFLTGDGDAHGSVHRIHDRIGVHALLLAQTGEFLERSEEHTSELQSRENLVCRLLLEK